MELWGSLGLAPIMLYSELNAVLMRQLKYFVYIWKHKTVVASLSTVMKCQAGVEDTTAIWYFSFLLYSLLATGYNYMI